MTQRCPAVYALRAKLLRLRRLRCTRSLTNLRLQLRRIRNVEAHCGTREGAIIVASGGIRRMTRRVLRGHVPSLVACSSSPHA